MTRAQEEQRTRALSRSGATCAVCGGSIYAHGTPQFAHKLSNSKKNRDKYGAFIIDHTLNGDYTCSLECNGRLLIDNRPREILMLLADIVTHEIKNFDL
jgi:hypothetical protein